MSHEELAPLEVLDSVRVLRLSHGANALDDALLDRLEGAFGALAAEGAPAVVLASHHPTIFCPGLDLRKLDGCSRDHLRGTMERYNRLLRELAVYPGPTVAAVSGHAIGGGCLLALACDRRVMTRAGARIGLSEINLGIPVPAGAVAMLLALYPARAVEQLVLEGDGLGGERALELGMVERLEDSAKVFEAAVRLARHLASRPPRAFAAAKGFLRRDLATTMAERDAAELERFLDHWYEPETQDRLGALVAAMGSR